MPLVTRHDLLVAGLRGLVVGGPLLALATLANGFERLAAIVVAIVALFSVVPGALAEGRAARRRPRDAREVLAGAREVLVLAGPCAAFGVVQALYCGHALAVDPAYAWSALAEQPGILVGAAVWGFVVAIVAGAAAVIRLESALRPERLDGGWYRVCIVSVLAGMPLLFVHTLADLLEQPVLRLAPSLRPEATT